MAKQTFEVSFDEKTAAALAEKTIEMYERKLAVKEEHRQQNLRRNIKKCLESYTDMKAFIENAIQDENSMSEDGNIDFYHLLELMGDRRAEVRLDGIRHNIAVTRLMLDHIGAMAKVLEDRAENAPKNSIARRRYNVFYNLYIADKKLTVEELVTSENVGRTQIYRDIDEIVNIFAGLIQGFIGVLGFSLPLDKMGKKRD